MTGHMNVDKNKLARSITIEFTNYLFALPDIPFRRVHRVFLSVLVRSSLLPGTEFYLRFPGRLKWESKVGPSHMTSESNVKKLLIPQGI